MYENTFSDWASVSAITGMIAVMHSHELETKHRWKMDSEFRSSIPKSISISSKTLTLSCCLKFFMKTLGLSPQISAVLGWLILTKCGAFSISIYASWKRLAFKNTYAFRKNRRRKWVAPSSRAYWHTQLTMDNWCSALATLMASKCCKILVIFLPIGSD